MNIETTDNSPLLQECIEELINSKIDEGKCLVSMANLKQL